MGSIITGTTSAAQLEEYIAAISTELSQEVLSAIDEIHKECRNPNISE